MIHSRILRAGIVIVILAVLPGIAWAQFGHPLKGQWSGQWGPESSPNRLLLDLHWDGTAMTGTINPGTDPATVRTVTFDYSDPTAWKVTLEAERMDASGKPVKIVAQGTLENLGSYYRVFRGTWAEGGQKGPFTVTRN